MKFIKKRQDDFNDDLVDLYDPDYYSPTVDNGSFEEEEEPVETRANPAGGVSFAGAGAPVALKLINPQGYEDGPDIADHIANGSTVLLNIEDLDKAVARRLMDFLFGAIHVLGGSTKKVTRTTFVFAPSNVGVSGFEGDESSEG